MRKNLSVEREFEREILDHHAFLRDEEEAARLKYEMECECGDWDLPEEDCGLTPEDEELIEDVVFEEVSRQFWEMAYSCFSPSVKCPAGWESV